MTDALRRFILDAYRELIAQGEPSMDPDDPSICAYVGEDDRGCAIGIMMPERVRDQLTESENTECIEVLAVDNHEVRQWLLDALEADDLDSETLLDLNRLQSCHDLAAKSDGEWLPAFKAQMRKQFPDLDLDLQEDPTT